MMDHTLKKISDTQLKSLDLHTLTAFMSGGEPVRAATIFRFIDKFKSVGFNPGVLYPCLGMAENSVYCSGRGPVPRPIAIIEASTVRGWVRIRLQVPHQ